MRVLLPQNHPESRPWGVESGWGYLGLDQQVKRRMWASPEGRGSLLYVSHGVLMGLIPGVDTGIATLVLFLTQDPLIKPLEC